MPSYTDLNNVNIGNGKLSVSTGTLEFDGPSNIFAYGTISGTGTLAFGAGDSQFSVNPTIANFLIDGGAVTFSNTLNYSRKFCGDRAGR